MSMALRMVSRGENGAGGENETEMFDLKGDETARVASP